MTAYRPYTLIAELTYTCPLRCAYCSNPLTLDRHGATLRTEDWQRVLREAEALGVVQLGLTGGEPLLRDDLETIVATARECNLYTNIATAGLPLKRRRLAALAEAGLDSVQISIQDTQPAGMRRIAGADALEQKRRAAGWVKSLGLPLTINVVLHRQNLDRISTFIALAESLDADRLELANTQYLGWALKNRAALLPTRAQLTRAREIAVAARERFKGSMEVQFVLPDYFSDYPKPCMDGWGRRFILVTPDGLVAPCHAAHTLPDMTLDCVKERSLEWIWHESEAFNRFRGEDWMPEPCASCDRRHIDFGGCRCQAQALTGDAARTDPACVLAPDHVAVAASRKIQGAEAPLVLRDRTLGTSGGQA